MNSKSHASALITILLALFLGSGIVQGESSDANSSIVIVNANFVATSPEKENLNDEWVDVANNGATDESMAGWILEDQQNHSYTFPDFNLKAGSTVRIHSGTGTDSESDLYWGRSTSIWNNEGDLATLMDASGIIKSSYPNDTKET